MTGGTTFALSYDHNTGVGTITRTNAVQTDDLQSFIRALTININVAFGAVTTKQYQFDVVVSTATASSTPLTNTINLYLNRITVYPSTRELDPSTDKLVDFFKPIMGGARFGTYQLPSNINQILMSGRWL